MHTILICDDDRDIVSALDIYLASEGYRTLKAYNGLEAIQAVERNEVHLILMDIMMPVMNEHLTKPLNCEKLIATIVKFL